MASAGCVGGGIVKPGWREGAGCWCVREGVLETVAVEAQSTSIAECQGRPSGTHQEGKDRGTCHQATPLASGSRNWFRLVCRDQVAVVVW